MTLKDIDYSALQQCMHCGLCLSSCPTYVETGRERNSPRGRISLMRAIADDRLAITETFADEMSYCVGCLACTTACPAGVDYAELLEVSRSDIEKSGVADRPSRTFIRWATLKVLFTHPRLFHFAAKALRFWQRSGLEKAARKSGLIKLLPDLAQKRGTPSSAPFDGLLRWFDPRHREPQGSRFSPSPTAHRLRPRRSLR